MDVIPVTIVGGYLGAGKTTLLNALLAGGHRRRISVLVNDFGAISLDEKLIVARDGDIVTLANGCACCALGDDVGTALTRLAKADPRPEHIVIEASGVAEPWRVAALARAPGLLPHAPIVLADAETLSARVQDKYVGRLVRAQFREAGLIVLNKIDLVDAPRRAQARDLLHRLAPGIPLIETARAALDPALVLNRPDLWLSTFFCDAAGEAAATTFESYSWITPQDFNLEAMLRLLAGLPRSILRIKGVFAIAAGSFEIHRVGARLDVSPLALGRAAPGATLNFIARSGAMNRARLDAQLTRCLARGLSS